MRRIGIVAPLLATALLAAPAHADVLVSRPPSSLACGEPIRAGVWYREFPDRGRRAAAIELRSSSGAVLARRTLTATRRWRYVTFDARCGRRYRVRYVTATATTTFEVRVRTSTELGGRRA